MDWLKRQEIHQLTHATRRNTVIKPIVATAPNQHWQMDLFDMQKFKSPQNRQAEYVLSVIDVFSKYIWLKPLTKKDAPPVARALEQVFNENGTRPKKIQSDNGTEFTAKVMTNLLKQQPVVVQVFSNSYSPTSQGIVERSNRTIKSYIFKRMLMQGNTTYVPWLDDIAYNYNHTPHATTGEIPAVLHTGTQQQITSAGAKIKGYADNLLKKRGYKLPSSLNLQRGDWVRLDVFTQSNSRRDIRNPVHKQTWDIRWTKEIYLIYKINRWVDKLGLQNMLIWVRDTNGRPINRAFQPNQVLKIPSRPNNQGPDIQHGPDGAPPRLPPATSRRPHPVF
jgi:transposase InsO family protein